MKETVLFTVIVGVVVAAFLGYGIVLPLKPTAFTVTNVSLRFQEDYFCKSISGPCTPIPAAYLYATVFVSSSSPLSCFDVHVNGAMEEQTCWNLTAPGFPYSECSGSGSNYSCTTGLRENSNTQTVHTFLINQRLLNGSNDTPIIIAGRSYSAYFIAHFQDGSESTASANVVAAASTGNSTTSVSVTLFTTSKS